MRSMTFEEKIEQIAAKLGPYVLALDKSDILIILQEEHLLPQQPVPAPVPVPQEVDCHCWN